MTMPIEQSANLRLLRLKARRKRWLKIHWWLGLLLGFLLAIYGITGSILVFHSEIDEWLNSELLTVTPPKHPATYQPLAAIFAAGRSAMPEPAKSTFATYPRNDSAAFKLNYSLAVPGDINESWQVYVDPYSAQVLGKRLLNRSEQIVPNSFIGLVFMLHYALLIKSNEISSVLVGISGALLIISTLTGLIVWWPLTGRWRQALSVKRNASTERFTFDLHKVSGCYTALLLIPVLFSGVYMVLPEHVVPVLEVFSPVTYRYWFRSTPQPGMEPIGMAQAVAIAKARYPAGQPDWIYGAPNPTNTYTVCLDEVNQPGSLLQRRCLVMDRYSGAVLDVDDPANGSAGEVFTHWQWSLHSGQAFGMTGRLLVFCTGLACPLLFVTGVIRWLQKQRSTKPKTPVEPIP